MANFLAELKRRNIYRVGAAYAVVAWVLLQLSANVAPILDLPPWIARTILLLLVLGFPVALVLAWTVEPKTPATAGPTTKIDFVLAGALFVVIALVSYQQLASSQPTRTAENQQPGVAAARTASATQAGAISVAVLPFANLSGDAAQEFFSDGMTEEIMTALAKVSALRIVGRESAFQFKGQKTDMHAVGQALGASYLVEGSVRKAGDQVRITAQLVQADNGVSVWTDSYDREMKNIFATQSDIAQAIAGALRVPLGLKQGETLVRDRTKDLASYDQYLRARALVRVRAIADAIKLLEPAVVHDPDYAPAWGLLAYAYMLAPGYTQGTGVSLEEARRIRQFYVGKAEMAAQHAAQLDPKNPAGYTALAALQAFRGNSAAADDLYRRALGLDPDERSTGGTAGFIGSHRHGAVSLTLIFLCLRRFGARVERA